MKSKLKLIQNSINEIEIELQEENICISDIEHEIGKIKLIIKNLMELNNE